MKDWAKTKPMDWTDKSKVLTSSLFVHFLQKSLSCYDFLIIVNNAHICYSFTVTKSVTHFFQHTTDQINTFVYILTWTFCFFLIQI